MDHNVNAAAQHFAAEESANEHACYRAAHANGLTPAQADECDDGDKGCPACPFKRACGVTLVDGQTKPLSGTAAPLVSEPAVQVDAPLPPTLTEGELWELIHKDFPFANDRWEKLLTFGQIKVVVERVLADRRQRAVEQTEFDDFLCNTHPDAPHGFNRNASHNAGRYVCDCEGWTPEPMNGADHASPRSDEKTPDPAVLPLLPIAQAYARLLQHAGTDAKLVADLESLRHSHWTHWTAEENHVVATAVRVLRELNNWRLSNQPPKEAP